jgi:formiminotetrahydrofolate cyclodeaminase
MEKKPGMPASIRESTVEQFRSAVASVNPMPAGVSASAVSASLALGLLAKVLQVSGRRKDFSGDRSKLSALLATAQGESQRMLQFAEDDIAAFHAYMIAVRLPHATASEQQERAQAIASAVRAAIDMPLGAARAAAADIGLCADAAGMAHAAVAADLGAAAALLASALRVFLLCADSNIRQLTSGSASYGDAASGRQEWETRAFRQAEEVLQQMEAAIRASRGKESSKS